MKCGIVQLAICLILFDYRSVACDDHTRIIQDREQKIEENGGTDGTDKCDWLTTRFVLVV